MLIQYNQQQKKNILAKLGINATKVETVDGETVSMDVTPNSIKLSGFGEVQTVQMNVGALTLLMEDKLGSASKQAVGFKVDKALSHILEAGGTPEGNPSTGTMKESGWASEKGKKAAHAEAYGATDPEAVADEEDPDDGQVVYHDEVGEMHTVKSGAEKPSGATAEGDFIEAPNDKEVEELMNVSPTNLSEANHLYQPVHGTSETSRYFVVAILDDLKVAARYKGNSLSVRAEGDVKKYKKALEVAGFPLDNLDKGYVSMHVAVDHDIMASRTVGALVAGLNTPTRTPMPNVKMLKEKGA